ncbi:MAG: protein-disulfide reductase DsbD family protein [Bradymonadaceae bacterium]
MTFILRASFFILSLLVLCVSSASALEVPGDAYGEDAYDGGEPRVRNFLVTDAEVLRPGDRFRAGVLFQMSPQWHIYWRDSGQGGMETEVIFESEDATAGDVQWPAPTVKLEAGGEIITYGYGNEVLLFAEFLVPDDASGEIEIQARVDYLVCKVDCIPGKASLKRTIAVAPAADRQGKPASRQILDYFEDAAALVPRTTADRALSLGVSISPNPVPPDTAFEILIEAVTCHAEGDADCLLIDAPPQNPAQAFAFASDDSIQMAVSSARPHPEAHSGWLIELSGRTSPDKPSDDGLLDGVLLFRSPDGKGLATAMDAPFPRTAEARPVSSSASATSTPPPAPVPIPAIALWKALLLAFLGGMLLNLMPCVFPVLAIKVFAFLNVVHEERHNLYIHSAAYTGGIVSSLLALAAVVIGLKMVGTQVGWGFQFQEPLFIAIVGAVLVIFALNLFGAFQVGVSAGDLGKVVMAPPGPKRSFGEGILAVILATPCSAPFLGTAVGFALASSTPMILLVFATLGLGLAAPFVLLTMVPGLASRLPRPGPWMEYFKQFLGFALLGTTIWLIWLIGQMAGVGGILRLLIFLMACALGAWLFGIVQYKGALLKWSVSLIAVALIVGTGVLTLDFSTTPPSSSAASSSTNAFDNGLPWQPWSEDAVQAELAKGRPVFVDFTADWCITCKVNKATVLETTEVIEAVEALDVAMFMADWTRRDDTIRAKLAEFGKAGVPLYLMYSPDQPHAPRVLPELITRAMIVEAMTMASP